MDNLGESCDGNNSDEETCNRFISGDLLLPNLSMTYSSMEEEEEEEEELPPLLLTKDEDTRDAAMLLAFMATSSVLNTKIQGKENRFSHLCSVFEEEYQEMESRKQGLPTRIATELDDMKNSRVRTVSISYSTEMEDALSSSHCNHRPAVDTFEFRQFREEEVDEEDVVTMKDFCKSPQQTHTQLQQKLLPAMISPPNSPYITVKKRIPCLKHDPKPMLPIAVAGGDKQNRPLQPLSQLNQPIKTILRRKFSWKNYPELESFLIANREEYLRHSALNYTIQQKQYNNRLTERLLELASRHGYVFDEDAFTFVTVRDRIRCYYKSYVQSSKKRGVIIGYAAKKAGLLSEDELEKSAGIAGRIIIPDCNNRNTTTTTNT